MGNGNRSQIAVQMGMLAGYLKTPVEVADTLRRIRENGYRNVEAFGVASVGTADLKRMLDDTGLCAIGYHIGLAAFRDDLDGVVDTLRILNCNHVALNVLESPHRQDGNAWKRMAREMTGIGKALARKRIVFQYHNHDFEFQKFDGRTGFEILYDESDGIYVKAELDTCWVARGGADPALWIRRLRKRIDQVHVKDTVMLEGKGAVFAEVGEGNLNWPRILKACQAAGVRDYIVEQDSCPITNDPFKSIAISYDNLRKAGLK